MVNKILAADDNVEIIRFLKPYLIKAGFQVNVPIIMITARSDDADKIMALDTGADDYVVKPY
jgi:DNA-binding response OmpR family regulator